MRDDITRQNKKHDDGGFAVRIQMDIEERMSAPERAEAVTGMLSEVFEKDDEGRRKADEIEI
jgi:hypothetical protein